MLYSIPPPPTTADSGYVQMVTKEYREKHNLNPFFDLKEAIEGFSLAKKDMLKNYRKIEIYIPKHKNEMIALNDMSPELYEWMKKKEGFNETIKKINKLFPKDHSKDPYFKNTLGTSFDGSKVKIYNVLWREHEAENGVDSVYMFFDLHEGSGYGELTLRTDYFYTEIGTTLPEEEDLINLGITPLKKKFGPLEMVLDLSPFSTKRHDGKMEAYLRAKFRYYLDEMGFRLSGRTEQTLSGGYFSVKGGIALEKILRKPSKYLEKILGGEIWIGVMFGRYKGERGSKNSFSIVFEINQ